MVPAGLPDHKFAIGIYGSIAFDESNFVDHLGAVVGFFDVGLEMFMLGGIAGVVCLFVHVDAVEVDCLDLLLGRCQLPLALALHAVVVVVLVGRRLHLLAATYGLLGGGDASEEGVGGGVGVDVEVGCSAVFCGVDL